MRTHHKHFLAAILSLTCLFIAAVPADANNLTPNRNFRTVPLPREVNTSPDTEGFLLTDVTEISAHDSLRNEREMLAEYVRRDFLNKTEVQCSPDAGENKIILRTSLDHANREAYRIDISRNELIINGASRAGLFRGIQTLRKALATGAESGVAAPVLPVGSVVDFPLYSYRGTHLDVSRHFFNLSEVKTFIEMMALHNLNTLHLHLTDDQGWRLEIKSRPRLAEIGSKRSGTVVGRNSSCYDNIPVSGHFSQEQAREIVAYAARHHITVIPEIDLPGHMQAALTAYPELGCTGGPYAVWRKWGVSDDVLCLGNPETFRLIEDVLNEVMDIFPSKYVHIGGDECPTVRWESCPKCQAKIRELGLTDKGKVTAERRLQRTAMVHAFECLSKRGRAAIGWDEVLEFGVPQDVAVMSWRGRDGAIKGTAAGHKVIFTPVTHCYFDYYQTEERDSEPLAFNGYVPFSRIYSLDLSEGIQPERMPLVMGVQANLWSEYILSFPHLQYMALPRMAALAEVGWCEPERKDYGDMLLRMPAMLGIYDSLGYTYAPHIRKEIKMTEETLK